MLKKRIIPTLLFNNHSLVKGKKFNSSRKVGSVMEAISMYDLREVDELFFFDIEASKENKVIDFSYVSEISKECFVPLCVGGGIKDLKSIYKLLSSGADKVSINSNALLNKNFIYQSAKEFGSQCIVVSLDYKYENDKKYIYIKSGSEKKEEDFFNQIKFVEDQGAGEILLTCIDRDGTMKGYDKKGLKEVKELINIPLIASGGAGSYQDMYEVISETNVDAVCAASIFHFTHLTPNEAKKFLREKKINVRN